MEQDIQPQPTQEPEEAKETPTVQAPAPCTREECKCLHEYGLIAMKNADGSVSQITTAQAKAMRDSLKQLEGLEE